MTRRKQYSAEFKCEALGQVSSPIRLPNVCFRLTWVVFSNRILLGDPTHLKTQCVSHSGLYWCE